MAKKHTLEDILKQKIREPKIIYLLGGGASFCAGIPGIFELTELVRSKIHNMSRNRFDDIIQSLIDNGIKEPNIEEILSELYYRLSAVAPRHLNREQFKTIFEKICQVKFAT